MRFLGIALSLCILLFTQQPPLTQASATTPQVFTLRVLPGQQAVAMADDEGRNLVESGRFSKYACTSLDGPDCGMVNGHAKLNLQEILETMLERIGSSRKATAKNSDTPSTSTSTSSPSSSPSTSTSGKTSTKSTDGDDVEDEVEGDGMGTPISLDQLGAINAALTKKIKQLFANQLPEGEEIDENGDLIEMQVVDGDVVDLSQVDTEDATAVHAFSIGGDGETHAITPEELKQLLKAAQMLQNKAGTQDQEQEEEEGQVRSPRPTKMTAKQRAQIRQQQQLESEEEEER